jgi:hypothetical protein
LVAELADGQLVKISQLDFTVKAESLKVENPEWTRTLIKL